MSWWAKSRGKKKSFLLGYQAEPTPRESDMHQEKGEGRASQLWTAAGRWDHPCYWQSAQPQHRTSPLQWFARCLVQLGPYPVRVSRPNWEREVWNTEHFLVKNPRGTTRNPPLAFEWNNTNLLIPVAFMQSHQQRTWFTLWKRLKNPDFPLHFVSPIHSMIKCMKWISAPQAWVSILKLIEWQGITDDDGLLVIHFWSWQAGVECFANVQAQETEMPDPERWLHWAFKSSYTVQPPISDCCLWRYFCLAGAKEGGAGIKPNGPGLLTVRY